MALFPAAKLTVLLPETGVIPGTTVDGSVELEVPAEIPRARHVELYFRSVARVQPRASTPDQHQEHPLFTAPMRIDLRCGGTLPAGRYSYPFSVAVPPSLPPAYTGPECSIRHSVEARLCVDWAVDPKIVVTPTVVLAPVETSREAITTRSRPGFYEGLVVDVTLENNALVEGEGLAGAIALRGGRDARFEAIHVTLTGIARLPTLGGDPRRGNGTQERIPAARLRTGERVPFLLRYPPGVPPTFRTAPLEHDVAVVIEVKTQWVHAASFEIPIRVVPLGSTVHDRSTDQGQPALGVERLAPLADAVAAETGFAKGPLPILAIGRVGPVHVQLVDGPRQGQVGLDVEMGFPDLGLGIVYRPLGMLEGFRQSPLLPDPLATSDLLRIEPYRAEGGEIPVGVPEASLRPFFGALLEGLDPRSEVRLSDRQLAFHIVLPSDGAADLALAARWTKERAEAIGRAIEALPFPVLLHPDAEAAWRATAREQSASLLPHIPALHGLSISARVVSGETRTLGVTLRVQRDRSVSADVDLRSAPLPPDGDLAPAAAVTAIFPRWRVHGSDRITLEGAAFVADPRTLLGPLEALFAWVLEARGEKRSDAPYR